MRSFDRPLLALSLIAALAGCADTSSSQRHRGMHRTASALPATPQARQCLAELGGARAQFTPLPDQDYGAGCATTNAVRLASLQGDRAAFALANLGPVACPLANSFAAWARFGVDRAAQQMLGSPLVRIETMGSYSCRNVAGTGRRSAHATGNAIDVAAFVLADGRRIAVLGQWREGTPAERAFLRTVQASACKRFGTVLGPDYDAAHANHLHVEINATGKPFCR